MFNNADLYPTPKEKIEIILRDYDVRDRYVLEPSAGFGNIVDVLHDRGAKQILACETDDRLRKILSTKCKIIENDFTDVKSEQISHIDLIVMNPPFSVDEKHVLHAFEIAPPGCAIVALCNYSLIDNPYSAGRKRLAKVIEDNGSVHNIGPIFIDAERTTSVNIGLIEIKKPGVSTAEEFEGFFLEEEEELQMDGIMQYNFVRDIVNRYINAVKLFDKQLDLALQMNQLTSSYFSSKIGFTCSVDKKESTREDYKKDLQKAAWEWIFNKMNMQKYLTKSLKDDLNKFVETQTKIPFTMKNIYSMVNQIIGTHKQRMDEALIQVSTRLTSHDADNRYGVEGWVTNSCYMFNKRLIIPYICTNSEGSKLGVTYREDGYVQYVDDLIKVLCYLTGIKYDHNQSLYHRIRCPLIAVHKVTKLPLIDEHGRIRSASRPRSNSGYSYHERLTDEYEYIDQGSPNYGEWFVWNKFFKARGYKKGTLHLEFLDEDVWGLLNQNMARVMGYPLFQYSKTNEKNHAKTTKKKAEKV
jgi:predicted RNA methylase